MHLKFIISFYTPKKEDAVTGGAIKFLISPRVIFPASEVVITLRRTNFNFVFPYNWMGRVLILFFSLLLSFVPRHNLFIFWGPQKADVFNGREKREVDFLKVYWGAAWSSRRISESQDVLYKFWPGGQSFWRWKFAELWPVPTFITLNVHGIILSKNLITYSAQRKCSYKKLFVQLWMRNSVKIVSL